MKSMPLGTRAAAASARQAEREKERTSARDSQHAALFDLQRAAGNHAVTSMLVDEARVHTDGDAQRLAMEHDAAAVTIGRDVYFAAGRYRPDTRDGARLLGHELAHVVQQTGPSAEHERPAARGTEALEHEATSAGEGFASGRPLGATPLSSGAAPAGTAQADPGLGPNEHHMRGAPTETGVGVIYVKGWSTMTPDEQAKVLAWAREVDVGAGGGNTQRQEITPEMKRQAASTQKLAQGSAALGLGSDVAAHSNDVTAGGNPLGPIMALPPKANSSIGPQWKRYQKGFTFEGISVYDHDTGQWIYVSGAVQHEPAPMHPGPPPPAPAGGAPRRPAAPPAAPPTAPPTSRTPAANAPASAPASAPPVTGAGAGPASVRPAPPSAPPSVRGAAPEVEGPPSARPAAAAAETGPPSSRPTVGHASSPQAPKPAATAPHVDVHVEGPQVPAPPKGNAPAAVPEAPPPSAAGLAKKVDTSKPPQGASFHAGVTSAMKGAAIGMALDFANNMLKGYIGQLMAEQQLGVEFAKLGPAIDAMLATNPKQIHAVISVMTLVPSHDVITSTGVEEKTGFPMVFVSVKLADKAVEATETTTSEDNGMTSMQTTKATYSKLILDVEGELKKQEIARDEAKLNERIRALAKENAGRPQTPAPAAPTPSAAAPNNSLMPQAPKEAPSLLPGAPAPSVNQEDFAAYAKGYGAQLLAEAVGLRNAHAPEKDRTLFMRRVQVWRGQMRKLIREFGNFKAKDSLTTTLLSFDEKMASLGSELGIDSWKDE